MINLNRFLDKFCNQTVIDDRFLQPPNLAIEPGMPHYLTDKNSNVIKHRVYSGEPILSTLDIDNLDVYILLSEITLCYPGLLMVGGLYSSNFENWYEVESLNQPSDFINLEDDDVVLVTRKDTGNMVARGRFLKFRLNSVELGWGDGQNLELFTFHSDIYDFYKLIKIK